VGLSHLAASIDAERLLTLGGPVSGGDAAERTVPRGWRQAAVLVPFHLPPEAVEPELVLVRRRDDAPTHSGEVAFPGGVRAGGEDLADTALREAEEEAGVERRHVRLRTRLPVTQTFASRFLITPFVATVHHVAGLRPQESEIERVLRVPVSELLHVETYRSEIWDFGPTPVEMSFFDIEGETVWGFTARVLRQILDALLTSDAESDGRT
jgi:8-oxo-dGTP pyrophosphatase MutT (NUDIX family)